MIINYRVSSRGGWNRKHNHVIEAVRAVCLVCDLFATFGSKRGRAYACANSPVRRIVLLYNSKFLSNYSKNDKDQVPSRPP